MITREEFERMEKLLDGFSFPVLHNTVMVLFYLEQIGYTTKDLKNFVTHRLDNMEQVLHAREKKLSRDRSAFLHAPLCPECKTRLVLKAIKTKQGKGNIYGYRSHWYCLGENCLYEKYSKMSYEYHYRKLLRKSKGKD